MQDKSLSCRDCGQTFTWTASEQEFFAQKGYTNAPSRCPECRSARRASRGEGVGTSSSTGGYGTRREMFPAVCAQCGKQTQVPFQPRTDRPVYCSDCYSTRRASTGMDSRSMGGGRDRRR